MLFLELSGVYLLLVCSLCLSSCSVTSWTRWVSWTTARWWARCSYCCSLLWSGLASCIRNFHKECANPNGWGDKFLHTYTYTWIIVYLINDTLYMVSEKLSIRKEAGYSIFLPNAWVKRTSVSRNNFIMSCYFNCCQSFNRPCSNNKF